MNAIKASLVIILLIAAWLPSVATAAPIVSHQRLEKILHLPKYRRWQDHYGYRAANRNEVLRALDSISREFWQGLIKPLLKWVHWHLRYKRSAKSHYRRHGSGWGSGGAWGLGAAAGGLGKLLLIFLIFIVIGMAAWIGWSLWKQRHSTTADQSVVTPPVNIKKALSDGDALAQGADAWLDLAQQLGDEGNWRMAYRAMYLALLSGLNESGRIQFRKSLTNRAYVGRYRGPTDEIHTFSTLTDVFDRVWYGDKPVSEENRGVIVAQVRSLLKPPVIHA